MDLLPSRPKKSGRPRKAKYGRISITVGIDAERALWMRRNRDGKMSDDVNKALDIFYDELPELQELRRLKESLYDRQFICVKCGLKFSAMLDHCPECKCKSVVIHKEENKHEN